MKKAVSKKRPAAAYTPSAALLKKYADVMIRFALNSGDGIKKGDVVYLVVQKPGLPLAKEMYRTILAMGGYPIVSIIDDEFKLLQVKNGSKEQLSFFPDKYYRGLADSIDHWVRIVADEDPMYLKSADPAKVLMSNRAAKPYHQWLDQK
jgi:aminopeptidase